MGGMKSKIKKRGISISFIASRLGIDRRNLHNYFENNFINQPELKEIINYWLFQEDVNVENTLNKLKVYNANKR